MQRIYRASKKLLADFTDLPSVVYDAIHKGLYKFVSVELLGGIKADTRVIPWVLDAVALLGADQPAVGTLKDLQALTMRRAAKFRGGKRVAFRRAVTFTEDNSMTPEEINAAIAKAVAPFQQKLEDADKATKAEFKRLGDEAAAKDAAHKKELAKVHRERIDERFNRAIEAGGLLPAKREQFKKLTNLDDDDRVMKIELKDVDTFIEENTDKTKLTRKSPTSKAGRADAPDYTGKSNQFVFSAEVEAEVLRVGGKINNSDDLDAAARRVHRAQPELGKAYLDDPNGAFSAAA